MATAGVNRDMVVGQYHAMLARTDPVPIGRPSFLDARRAATLDLPDVDVAVVGIRYTTPADLAQSRAPSSPAPAAVRAQSLRWRHRGRLRLRLRG
jgi:hypothetical protein